MRYTKKPVTIEAILFTGDNCLEIIRWMGGPADNLELKNTDHPYIHTLEGDMLASPGDYVIKGVKGEFYPCKPDIFRASYTNEDGSEIS